MKAGKKPPAARVTIDPPGLRRGERGIRDDDTGRTWTWRESDQPGLSDFLACWLMTWHPFAFHGWKRKEENKAGGRAAAVARKANVAMRDAELHREIRQYLANDKTLSNANVANILETRGFGDAETIRKKVAKIRGARRKK